MHRVVFEEVVDRLFLTQRPHQQKNAVDMSLNVSAIIKEKQQPRHQHQLKKDATRSHLKEYHPPTSCIMMHFIKRTKDEVEYKLVDTMTLSPQMENMRYSWTSLKEVIE